MKLVFGAVFLCLAAGCGPMGPINYDGGPSNGGTSAQFSPHSAVRPDPSTTSAVRIYEGDKDTLRNAGATFVGDLDVDAQQKMQLPFDGKRQNYDGLAPRAAMEAAKVGATHFILVDAGVDVREYTVEHATEETQQQTVTDQYGRTHTRSVTTHRPAQSIKTESQRGRFALFHVDPSRWNDLPPQLRPISLEAPASTTTTTSAPAPAATPAPAPTPLPAPSPSSNSKAAKKKAGY